MSGSVTSSSTQPFSAFNKARFWDVICGGLLIAAASMKVLYPAAADITAAYGGAFTRYGATAAVAIELLLGWGLVAGVSSKYLRPLLAPYSHCSPCIPCTAQWQGLSIAAALAPSWCRPGSRGWSTLSQPLVSSSCRRIRCYATPEGHVLLEPLPLR